MCESVYHFCDVPVPNVQIGGDQLTRERFYGAKRLRAAVLENLSPITFELFHLQMNFLTTFYSILYSKTKSEPFTVHAHKIRLQRREANGEEKKNHYGSCKELAESLIRANIVEAACNVHGLSNISENPDNFPEGEMVNEEMRMIVTVSQIMGKLSWSLD